MKPAMQINPPNPDLLKKLNNLRHVINRYDISFNQAALLSIVPGPDPGDSGIAPSEVADIMGLSRGGVTRLVQMLLNRNLVTSTRDMTDQRYVALKRTKRGFALISKISADASIQVKEPA